jgi:four helix bundle protein
MANVACFEDLVAWQKARELNREVYRITGDQSVSRDWNLTRQIRRAAISIMSNIAEGYERRAPRDFQRFLTIAKASCAEVRSLLYVARDVGYLDDAAFKRLMARADEVARIIAGPRNSIVTDEPTTRNSELRTRN